MPINRSEDFENSRSVAKLFNDFVFKNRSDGIVDGLFDTKSAPPLSIKSQIDILDDVKLLKSQIEFFREVLLKDEFPCLVSKDLQIPINIQGFYPDDSIDFVNRYNSAGIFEKKSILNELIDLVDSVENVEFVPIKQISPSFKKSIQSFLNKRTNIDDFENFNKHIQSKTHFDSNTETGTIKILHDGRTDIEISTDSSHLTIDYSTNFFVNWKYFGGLTTPAIGRLKPGEYLFRARGGVYSNAPYVYPVPILIPPNFKFHLDV